MEALSGLSKTAILSGLATLVPAWLALFDLRLRFDPLMWLQCAMYPNSKNGCDLTITSIEFNWRDWWPEVQENESRTELRIRYIYSWFITCQKSSVPLIRVIDKKWYHPILILILESFEWTCRYPNGIVQLQASGSPLKTDRRMVQDQFRCALQRLTFIHF